MSEPTFVARGDGVLFHVHVQPRASRNEVAGLHGAAIQVRLQAPPVEGEANAALVAFLAERLGVGQRAVEIVSGHRSRTKRVVVRGLAAAEVRARLGV